MNHRRLCILVGIIVAIASSANDVFAQPAPPAGISASDHPWDDGSEIDVEVELSDVDPDLVYVIEQASEFDGLYHEVERRPATESELESGILKVTTQKNIPGNSYWYRASVVEDVDGEEVQSEFIRMDADSPAISSEQFYDGDRFWLAVITVLVCGSVVAFILMARSGTKLKIRPIAGLEAIEEAVGRATEMGRSCLFVPGIQDMNDIQTIAGLTILSRVAEQAAEYDCTLETPTSKSLVMTAARETVATAFLKAGRPEAYNNDLIYYVTDEQFAYVSFLTGKMVREKPAACFYLGAFFAESLILAETGNAIGAIQVAGTAQPAQLPFFVAACDYTLIGEEFFAASAYLSKDPDQLGSLKGQDFGKVLVGGLILIGVFLVTIVDAAPPTIAAHFQGAADFLMNDLLQSG
ncbi:hypothetical protein KOR42_43120 [Thalassoglobus neptunius]|uniref:DUF6754 domain-containing protein n=1 Tax=Thalassoglobus neptunius TaxID=1938619 RepID=A0A5C5W7U0_9PLAN|nr:DUF6754 domain-containing protein [Thalassoglobus neptunius]TWT46968.1 hypothetical protein KOR42_43120 [Thalassoglobus neptunius]